MTEESGTTNEDRNMKRKNIAAFTEDGTSYPAFVSVNYEGDGTCSIIVRERGHDGTKGAQITGLSREAVRVLAHGMIEGEAMLDEYDG